MWSKAGPLLFGSLAAVCRGRQNPGAFCTIWVRLRSSEGPGGGGGRGLNSSSALRQLVLSISNRLTGKQILSNRKTHFNSKGSERLKSPFPLR